MKASPNDFYLHCNLCHDIRFGKSVANKFFGSNLICEIYVSGASEDCQFLSSIICEGSFQASLHLVKNEDPLDFVFPWAWGINGCFSVIAPALATVVAVQSGFRTVYLLAADSYLLAMVSAGGRNRI